MLDPADNLELPPIPRKRYFTIGEVSESVRGKAACIALLGAGVPAAQAGQAPRQPPLLPAPRCRADSSNPPAALCRWFHHQRCPQQTRHRNPQPAKTAARRGHPYPDPGPGRRPDACWNPPPNSMFVFPAILGIMRTLGRIGQTRGVAQPGSAPQWGCGGRRFKSSRPDHISFYVNEEGVRIPGLARAPQNRLRRFP